MRMPGGDDVAAFSPEIDATGREPSSRLTGRPVIVCVSRLMPRKGQDTLIKALPQVREQVPDAALLMVRWWPVAPRAGAASR